MSRVSDDSIAVGGRPGQKTNSELIAPPEQEEPPVRWLKLKIVIDGTLTPFKKNKFYKAMDEVFAQHLKGCTVTMTPEEHA